MRGRVSDKIYGQDAEFRGHRDHRDKLSELDARVAPALETAKKVNQDLQDVESHLKSRSYDLMMATMHEHDVETYTDDDGNEQTRVVDNSGMWKMLAANEASSAQAAAAAANAGMAALKPEIEALRRDPGIQAEGLGFALMGSPSGNSNGAGFLGVWGDLFLPGWISMIGTISSESQASHAQAQFAPALNGLQTVDTEIRSRQGQEAGWVDAKISADLQGQLEQAKGQSY
jgi:hypothetical protein